jgi:hypothetical protein
MDLWDGAYAASGQRTGGKALHYGEGEFFSDASSAMMEHNP